MRKLEFQVRGTTCNYKYNVIKERKEIMKQIIENLMKHTRHTELDSVSHSVILSGAKNLNLPLTLALSLKGRGKSVSSAKPTAKSIKVVPTSTGRATCVAHDKNLSTYRLNVLDTDKNPLPNPLPRRGNKVKSALPQGAREKCAAFTLAEVLITLGIIGIVAALTLPVLINNYKTEVLKNQLKQTYSDLGNTAKMFQIHNDMSIHDYANEHNSRQLLSAISKEFKVLKINLSVNTTVPYLIGFLGGKPRTTTFPLCNDGGYFVDTKGRLFAISTPYNSNFNGPYICVDINGKKGPNLCGVDIFTFVFTVDGSVIPYGQPHSGNDYIGGELQYKIFSPQKNYCNVSDTIHAQVTCSGYALLNKHPKKDGMDYWHDFINMK